MNRKLKFRARIVGTDEWIYDFGFYPSHPTTAYMGLDQAITLLGDEFTEEHGNEYEETVYFNIEHLTQWMEVADKSGKDIYRGDIIEFIREAWQPEGPRARFRKALDYPTLEKVTREADAVKDGSVIGNIFENPELLENKFEILQTIILFP